MPETCNDYALPFATWEVRLYLDTHPGDARALALYQQLCAQSQGMPKLRLPAGRQLLLLTLGLDRQPLALGT